MCKLRLGIRVIWGMKIDHMDANIFRETVYDYCPVLPKNGNGPTVYSQSFDQRITFPVKTQRRRRSFIIERVSIQVGQTVFCGESEKLMAYQRHRPSLG
ncbi:hypothetical protein HOLleu_05758 [Holothuria leucospilota]|uniref:Uncharacterized protein n=1 Tax=Holothuria leucospilota TaxID=206669 RepID=A0A9Q1HJ81_HOLLE|nr:hypothetical protein HOLleu_05758 [Holothuria leucospilota]